MNTTRIRGLSVCLAAVAAVCGFAVPQLAQAHKRKATGRITANPTVLAAGETTTLEGTGFSADEKITLRECPTKGSNAPRYPCNSTLVTVETDASGGFTATFPVTSCYGEKKSNRPQKCYVGDYKWGEDAFLLLGAVKLTVTP